MPYTELESLTFTQRPGEPSSSRYIEVCLGDELISQHLSQDEAVESAIADLEGREAGDYDYEFRTPNTVMSVRLINPAIGGQGTGGQADITPPLAPAGGFLSNYAADSVRINWASNSEPDLDYYRVYKSTTSSDGPYTALTPTIPAPATNYTDQNYDPSVQAWYRLTAVDNVGNQSEFSAPFTDNTPPNAPDAPTLFSRTTSSITITLPTSAALDHASFRVLVDGVQVAQGVTASTHQITGLTPGTTYSIACRDEDVSGNVSSSGSALSQATVPSQTGENTNAERISGVTSQADQYAPPFAINAPDDPQTTAQVTASSVSEIVSALSMSGTEVTITPGTYDFRGQGQTFSLAVDDLDVIATGVTINGTVSFGATGPTPNPPSRIRLTGGTYNGEFERQKVNDLMIDNVNVLTDYNVTGDGNEWVGGAGDGSTPSANRIALINATMGLRNSPSEGEWIIYISRPFNGPPPDHASSNQHHFFGNCIFRSNPGQLFRIHDMRNWVFVGCMWNDTYTAANGPRFEHEMFDGYIKDCVAFGSTIQRDGTQTRCTVDHFLRFHTTANPHSNMFDSAVSCTVNNSPFGHDSAFANPGSEIGLGQATGSNNIIFDWDGSLSSAQTRITSEGLDWIVGADH